MKTDSDTVIKEIRESRRHMSEQSGHDPGKYIEHLKTFNRKYATQIEQYQKLRRLSLAERERSR